jgi:hypothetical protein
VKVATADRNVETFGLGETSGFTIEATAKAFEILSSGLYKDKITAILREISANGADAHTAAGIPERPIHVHLPTTLNPYLSIRDFGQGLSHKLMLKLYQTYFGSLKSETNDLIGGLGLGSKSPFSYTDSYTVISRSDNEKRTYDLYRDDNGEPQIALRSTEPLDGDETGLEVVVPLVNNYDTREFAQKACHVYEFYPVKPTFSGGSFSGVAEYSTVLEGKGWRITDRQSSRLGAARAVMGIIAYPIDADNAISVDEANTIKQLATARRLLRAPIDIEFGIGDLDITAGREELSYVKATKAALRRRLVEIVEEIDQTVQSEFTACKSVYEAKKLYGTLFGYGSTLNEALGENYKVTFRGVEITDTSFLIDMTDFPESKLILYKDSKRGSPKFTKDYKAPDPIPAGTYHRYRDEREFKLRIDAQERVPTEVYYDDLGGAGQHSSRIFHYRVSATRNRPNVILIQTSKKKELKKLAALLDGITIRNISELPKPSYERSYTKAKLKVLSTRARTSKRIDGPKDGPWNETDVTVETGGIMVITSRGQIVEGPLNENAERRFSELFLCANKLGLIAPDENIVAVPLSMAKQFTESKKYEGKWVNFFDLIAERGRAAITPEIQQTITEGNALMHFEPPTARNYEFEGVLKNLSDELGTKHQIAEFRRLYRSQPTVTDGAAWLNYRELAELLSVEVKGDAVDLNAEWRTISSAYPMLRFVMDSYGASENVDKMVEYIRLVDTCGNNG